MKNLYETPVVEVIAFDAQDVVVNLACSNDAEAGVSYD